jgi:TonB family protein
MNDATVGFSITPVTLKVTRIRVPLITRLFMRRVSISAAVAVCLVGLLPITCNRSFAQQEQTEVKRRVVTKVVPLYPELARKMHITGIVRIEVIVPPDGSPKTIRVMGGHPVLAQAATDAIHKWKWAPVQQETTELIEMKFNPD